MPFIGLRKFSSIPSFLNIFIMKGFWKLSNAFSTSFEMIMWFLLCILLIWFITFILYVKPTLHSWDKSQFLYLAGFDFIVFFASIVIRGILLSFLFFFLRLCFFWFYQSFCVMILIFSCFFGTTCAKSIYCIFLPPNLESIIFPRSPFSLVRNCNLRAVVLSAVDCHCF